MTTDSVIGGGIMPRPPWITPTELGRIQDRHPDIEQDTLPDTAPDPDADSNEEAQ